jgi:hypothetical protein
MQQGAPYHGGEWLATLLDVQPTDISYGAVADNFFSKFEIEAMFLVTGEGKGNADAHFSMVSQCEKMWVNKGSEDTAGGSSLNKLTESTMPDLMRFCERWIGSTKIEMLPEGFRDVCPKGEFNKLSRVRGLHHFWKKNGVIKARAYSHFGPVKEVEVEKGVKRAVSTVAIALITVAYGHLTPSYALNDAMHRTRRSGRSKSTRSARRPSTQCSGTIAWLGGIPTG